jgi:CheY-like chemotaxis protein/HPt (histidine-containing phosphotransfer) domain-containing protein
VPLQSSDNLIQELRLTNQQLVALSRAKSEFLATLSHEIRTPLNLVLGTLGLLLKTSLSEEQLGFVKTASESGQVLLNLIDNMLDLSKIETGHLELVQSTFDIVQLVESVAELLAPQAHDHHIEIATLVSLSIPRWLRGDVGRLRQVLLGLVSNAVKFTHKGGVAISVSLAEEEEEWLQLRFEVKDTGIGMAEAVKAKLFTSPYTDHAGARGYRGTGLGLVVARHLVVMMGGEIGCRSQLGQGSTFWFTVKCPCVASRSTRPLFSSVRGLRVLLVEDNPVSHQVHERQLEAWGVQVTGVNTGNAALAALREAEETSTPYATVLIDQDLPDITGEELGSQILSLPKLADSRLILMTKMAASSVSARIRQLGFRASLAKPVRRSSLYRWLCLVNGLVSSNEIVEQEPTAYDRLALPRKRILLAEDSQVSQILIVAMLEKAGYQVDTVSDGPEVLQALQTIPYDLVLMDVAMPTMNGFEAASEIRRLPDPEGHIPIIAITADNLSEIRERCFAVGMNDYLTKPVEQVRMLAAIERWLSLSLPHSEISLHTALDWQTLHQLEMDTDPALLDRAVSLFIDEAHSRLNQIAEACLVKDWKRLKKEAHALKSSAGTFGVRRFHQHALRLDEACQRGDWETALILAESIASVAAPELDMLAYHYGHRA